MEGKGKLVISQEKLSKIKLICTKRLACYASMDILRGDLKTFVVKEFKAYIERPDTQRKIKEGKLQSARTEDMDKYVRHLRDLKPASFRRAFEEGVVYGSYYLLEEIIDFYIEANRSLLPPDTDKQQPVELPAVSFSEHTMLILLKRAGNLCSTPGCLRLTVGPVLSASDKVAEVGKACAIRGSRPGDVRYDPAVAVERDSVENAIWLCAYHASLIEAGSEDYPAAQLEIWKSDHEELIKACMDGKKKITLSLNPHDDRTNAATAVIGFFAQQRVLCDDRMPYGTKDIIQQVRSIGDFLMEYGLQVPWGSKLEQQCYAIDMLCDAFLQRAKVGAERHLFDLFALFRKLLGMLLLETATYYRLQLPASLLNIIPGKPDSNT